LLVPSKGASIGASLSESETVSVSCVVCSLTSGTMTSSSIVGVSGESGGVGGSGSTNGSIDSSCSVATNAGGVAFGRIWPVMN
jgi:hypothetical protein